MIKEMNKTLLKLVSENPELELKFACHWDIAFEDTGYWPADIEKIEVDYVWSDEHHETNHIGEENIKEHIGYLLEYDDEYQYIDDDKFEKDVDKRYDEMVEDKEVQKFIIVFLGGGAW